MTAPPDADPLLARARAGDRAAFEALVAPQRDALGRFALMVGDDEPEEAVQEALLVALTALERFAGRSRLRTWLMGIVLNQVRTRRRKATRAPRAAGPEELGARPAAKGRRQGVLSSILRRELAARLEEAIARLPDTFREPFVLRVVENLPYAEVAEVVGISAGAARVRVHRAKAVLRAELEDLADSAWLRAEEEEP